MKRILALAAAGFMVAGLAGCGGSNSVATSSPTETYDYVANTMTDYQVPLSDGRTVLCVVNTSYHSISCDWANAR